MAAVELSNEEARLLSLVVEDEKDMLERVLRDRSYATGDRTDAVVDRALFVHEDSLATLVKKLAR